MIQVPSGVIYEPADTGFDNRLVAAATQEDGNILPWRAGHPFSYVCFFIDRVTGPGTPWDLRGTPFALDGQTALSAVGNLVATIGLPVESFSWFGQSNLSIASSGSVVNAELPRILFAPHFRISVNNQDALQTINVSVQVLLGR